MKKLYIIGSFVLLCSLAFTNQAKASIDIDFFLSISDNGTCCLQSPYTGTYHITVEFLTNNVVECTHELYTTSHNPEIAWTCGVTFDQYKIHSVKIKICHWNSLTGDYCCNNFGNGPNYIDYYMGGGTTLYPTVN
jgi:hypothetical protein